LLRLHWWCLALEILRPWGHHARRFILFPLLELLAHRLIAMLVTIILLMQHLLLFCPWVPVSRILSLIER
jgi:hypothetical protein